MAQPELLTRGGGCAGRQASSVFVGLAGGQPDHSVCLFPLPASALAVGSGYQFAYYSVLLRF